MADQPVRSAGRLPGGGGGDVAQAEAQKHSPLPPPPKPFHSSPGRRFVGLLSRAFLESTEVFRHRRRCTQEAEWTSEGRLHASSSRRPCASCLHVLAGGPWARRKSANPADSTNAPKHMLPAEATGQRQGDHHPGDSRTPPRGDVSAGHQKTAWIFPLSDETFQTIHPRVYFAPVWFV